MKRFRSKHASLRLRWLCVLILGASASAAILVAQGEDVNTIKSIRAVGPSTVEIELESSREFPVRDEVTVLRIGDRDFYKSRPPKGGSLKTLIFILTAEDFEQVANGAAVSVRYGKHDPDDQPGRRSARRPRDRWQFGKLDKSLIAR